MTQYLSANKYLILPTPKNPRVFLIIDNEQAAINSFKLYNPFSKKARLLKRLMQYVFVNHNTLAKKLFAISIKTKSGFLSELEKNTGLTLSSSLYFSTDKNKIVLQLQNNSKVIGYLKLPLTEKGVEFLEKEKQAIQLLSKLGLALPYHTYNTYKTRPYLILEELQGRIGRPEKKDIDKVLKALIKKEKYKLEDHPRVKGIQKRLLSNDPSNYLCILKKVTGSSKVYYHEVYEHGDFAPWNIITTNEGLKLFDFEYFHEEGIEFFDLIKYFYQIGKLLEKKRGNSLLLFVESKVNIQNFIEVFAVFLVKEALLQRDENKDATVENEILNLISIETT